MLSFYTDFIFSMKSLRVVSTVNLLFPDFYFIIIINNNNIYGSTEIVSRVLNILGKCITVELHLPQSSV